MFNTASPVNSSQSANNNARTTQQVETGDIITLKPNKQRTKGKKNKLSCSLLWCLNFWALYNACTISLNETLLYGAENLFEKNSHQEHQFLVVVHA